MALNLLFMNTLEKKVGDNCVISAQIVIGENKGIWYAMWSESKESGEDEQEHWYEGEHWQELISSFRAHLLGKLSEGYVPLVTVPWEESQRGLGEKAKWNALLQCYSESHANVQMMDALRTWRREKAKALSKAPYLIATNRMLEMIAALLPQSTEELKQIPGFGDEKVMQYGDDLFAITKVIERVTTFPLAWVEREVEPIALQQWLYEQKERKMQAEHNKSARKRRFLEAIWQGVSLDSIVKELSLSRRDAILMVEEMDHEGYDVTPLIDIELGQIESEDKERAWQQFEQHGDRYLKPVFQAICEHKEIKGSDSDPTYQWLRLLRILYRRAKTVQPVSDDMHSQAS